MGPLSGDGLQQARTALAWRRTVASAGATSALVAHHAVVSEHGTTAVLLLVGAAIVALGVASAACVRRRRLHASVRAIGLCTASVALMAVLGLVAA